MGDLTDFERGQLIGVRLAGASATKSATLLDISRMTVSKVMLTYTKSWEDNVNKEEQCAKINTDRKRLSYTEKDC
jgi:hypothetical protein